ncbi:MAG: diguanylate cyclase [Ottowia sp.]|uniref:diguanylate cyclase domain-containing protein n=1 Tax=Ottowia sp. TaxID=1898956 RepID=UPI003C70844A
MTGADSLRDVIRGSHLRMAWTAILLAGSLLLSVGATVLWLYLGNNLQLLARTLSYTIEASLVFRDNGEADRVLKDVLSNEGVARAQVFDNHDKLFAQWSPYKPPVSARVGERLARAVGLPHGVALVKLEDQVVGKIVLTSDGVGLMQFFGAGIVVLGVCLGVSGYAGLRQSRRILTDIVEPLQDLASVASAVRHDRLMDKRVPLARMAELRTLGEHFNALLAELQARQQRLRQENSVLSEQALRDGLTGLANRLFLEQRLQQGIADVAGKGQGLALLYIDVNRLKEMNDGWGHAAGDTLLKEVAKRLQAHVRVDDLVARLGGDEFAVLLHPIRSKDAADTVTRKILAGMEEPLVLDGGEMFFPSVSIGAAVFPEDGMTMQELLQHADQTMYQHKARHRDSYAAIQEV